jgi:hypothetical protein
MPPSQVASGHVAVSRSMSLPAPPCGPTINIGQITGAVTEWALSTGNAHHFDAVWGLPALSTSLHYALPPPMP